MVLSWVHGCVAPALMAPPYSTFYDIGAHTAPPAPALCLIGLGPQQAGVMVHVC